MYSIKGRAPLILISAVSATLIFSTQALAQHQEDPHQIDEIIVTSALNRSKAETALPVHVLSDESLREQAASTLGETLRNLPGVHTSSFGVGVGQPVIRGLSGNRVGILQNNVAVLDAAGVSQDHASAMEPLLAERVEVLRGPATLLYGNGAIGGVVNVIDNRIPQNIDEAVQGALEIRSSSVNQGNAVVAKLEGKTADFAWHLDGIKREGDNTEIPGLAIDAAQLDEPVEENSDGEIENSDFDADQFSLGASWDFGGGWVGISITELNNNYGIPPGAHEHHEEEEEEEHEEETIRIDMEQRRIDLKGEAQLSGWFNTLRWQLADNEYEHRELEGAEIGTRFLNDGREGRLSFIQSPTTDMRGTLGVQWLDRDFSAIGEEAFIPATAIESWGLFAVESIDFDRWVLELGARIDQQEIDTGTHCGTDETSVSASASVLRHWSDQVNIFAALNRSERAPSVEEAFSNVDLSTCASQANVDSWVTHAATGRVELGDPQLSTEVSNNFEVGLQKYRGDLQLELNAFINQFNDFIYLADIGEVPDSETIISEYQQDGAEFVGVEIKATRTLELENLGHLDFTVTADTVRAKLDSGDNVPRIPPAKLGLELAWIAGNWSAKLMSSLVGDQTDVSSNESATDGYTRWDFYGDYHWAIGDNELLLFTKVNNISDEEIRDHTSFLKNFAPAAGRDISLGVRLVF